MLLNDEFIRPDLMLSRSTTLGVSQELAVYMKFRSIVALLTSSLLSWPRTTLAFVPTLWRLVHRRTICASQSC